MNKQTCPSCKEREITDIHHIDENHKNNKKENLQPICGICHGKIHGIEAKYTELKRQVVFRDRALRINNAITNQLRGFSRIELLVPVNYVEQDKMWHKQIREYEKAIKKEVEEKFPEIWEWLNSIKGISHVTAGKLIAHIDIKHTPNISSLWRYCGLDATRIKRTRAAFKGVENKQDLAKEFGSPYLKKEMMGILADSFIRQKTPIYSELYYQFKERETARVDENKPKNKMHTHLRAKRKMVKIFLSHFWMKWREVEGLPVTRPYVEEQLGHTDIIR